MLKRLLREPLVHFLLIGAALFLAFRWSDPSYDAGGDRLVVTAGRIEALAASFQRSWQRPPTKSELDGLVEEWVREEVLYREALARGLDEDDAIVRRRLRQKLEFVAEDLAELAPPTAAELAEYLQSHVDAYRLEPKLALRQVYFDPSRRGEQAAADARAMLEKVRALGAKADVSDLGDPLRLLPDESDASGEPALATLAELDRLYGAKFTTAVEPLAIGEWAGPLESGFGLHLVLVTAREEGRVPALEEVRAAVARDWSSARRKELADAFYRGLRARYDVVVEWPAQ